MSTLPGVWIQLPVLSKNVMTDFLGAPKSHKFLKKMVGDAGFEPVTSTLCRLGGKRESEENKGFPQ